jgi:hypothetical protein
MAGSRTLKLSILADVDDLKKKLDVGANEVEGFGAKLEKFGKVAAVAFAAAAAAAGAYATKLAVDGVKAAIEDEAAQAKLANALQNVTGATNAQISAVEKQIYNLSLATGVADDQLRPAFQRLAVATGDLKRSQELLDLSLNISAATGKSVETVANALGKAYEGNTGALAKLGVGLSSAELKSIGLEAATKQLAATFEGAASVQANTLEGQIARLKVTFDETKEAVGARLLPIVQQLLNYFINTVIPKFIEFKDRALAPVTNAIENNKEALTTLYNFIKNFIVPVLMNGFGAALEFIGKVAGGVITIISGIVNVVKTSVSIAIDGINAIINAYNKIPLLPDIPTLNKPSWVTSTSSATAAPAPTTKAPSISLPSISTPSVSATQPSASAIKPAAPAPTETPTIVAPAAPFNMGAVQRGEYPAQYSGMGAVGRGEYANQPPVVINVNAPSVIDRENFARAVIDALNESADRGTGGGLSPRNIEQVAV